MGIISIPKALREKLGDEGSEALVEVLNKQSDENKQSIIDLAEQRFEAKLVKEASLLREEIADMKISFETKLNKHVSSLREEMAGMKTSFDIKLTNGISSVREDVHKTRSDLIKWMFIFWVGQIGCIVALLKII